MGNREHLLLVLQARENLENLSGIQGRGGRQQRTSSVTGPDVEEYQ